MFKIHSPLARVRLCVLLLAGACSSKPHDSPTQKTPAVSQSVSARPATAPLTRKAVEALLRHWLVAQNQGDFAQYAALYSRDFHGTRRTRELVKRFEHDTWLEDRQRMFAKPMFVAMRSVVVGIKHDRASVDFLQTWSSGTYSDEGAKRMIVRAEADGARISSEELLESRSATAASPTMLGMFVVMNAGPRSFAVLDGPIEGPQAGSLDLAAISEDDKIVVSRVLPPAMAGKFASLEGLSVQLIADGKSCTAQLGTAAAYKFAIPPESDESFATLRAPTKRTPSELAAALNAVWQLETPAYVAAPVLGSCGKPVAAVRVTAKPPTVLRRMELHGSEAEPWLSSFDAQPPGRAFAELWANYLRESEPNAHHDPTALGFKNYTDAVNALYRFDLDGKPRFATLTWFYGGCAMNTDAFAVTELTGEPRWREHMNAIGAVLPLAIFDADSDGHFEAVIEDTWSIRRWLVRLDHDEILSEARFGLFRCGC
jgi:hypothetical protein